MCYQLGEKQYKKRIKEETLLARLLYCGYKDVIPLLLRILYFLIVFVFVARTVACALLPGDAARSVFFGSLIFFDAVWWLIIVTPFTLSDSYKSNWAYEFWAIKKNKKRKK